MLDILQSSTLLLTLLNPFLVIVYLIDAVEHLEYWSFRKVLVRAGLISGAVFCVFAVLGDAIFSRLFQMHFSSFQIFGGVVFLVIGMQFVLRGRAAIEVLRGESEHLAGAIAMPILVGPGTISASVLIGERLHPLAACLAVIFAVSVSIIVMVGLKRVHDVVRPRNEQLVQRYIEVAGRITALFVGTVSIEMITRGLETWIARL